MKNALKKISLYLKGISLSLMLVAACAPVALADGDKPWTSIGSDTTVASGNVTYTGNIAYLNGNSAVLRYNVVAVDGLTDTGPAVGFPRLTARFRDNGGNGRVVVHLRRAGFDGSNVVNLLTIDSNDYPGSSSFQTRTDTGCGDGLFAFDFASYTYFVEVTMTRTGLPVTPGLASLKLDLNGACLALP
jgi:hypothetical protein